MFPVHYLPQLTCIGLCSYQNILFHPKQILSNTGTWQLRPPKHTESACHIPQDHSHRHLQTVRTPSDYLQASEEKMDFKNVLCSLSIPALPFPRFGTGSPPNRNSVDLPVNCIYIKGSTSHMFLFTCLKELFRVQTALCKLIYNF